MISEALLGRQMQDTTIINWTFLWKPVRDQFLGNNTFKFCFFKHIMMITTATSCGVAVEVERPSS